MDAGAQLAAAVAVAEQQLVWLRLGDLDSFISGSEAHEAACRSVLALAPQSLDSNTSEGLRQLIEVNSAAAAETSERMGELQAKLAGMNRGQRVSEAYLATATAESLSHFQG